ncbi:MAG: YraN family protein [Acidobacteriota bacterium]
MRDRRSLGRSGEEEAVAFLKRKKFKILGRGFRFHRGEIDIVAQDKETLVFVEVKTRRKPDFGRPEESVTPSKQNQIRKLAAAYMAINNLHHAPCRFDILSLLGDDQEGYEILHITDAF